MRHAKGGVKLNRTSSHRKAMFRNMVTSLFEHGQVKTTDAKAKELRRWADKMITLAKRGDLHARRQALSVIRDKDVVHKLFEAANERFGDHAGGYTRITKIGLRKGDAAPVSLVDFVGGDDDVEKGEKGSWLARFTKRGKAAKEEAAAAESKAEETVDEAPAAEEAQEAQPAAEETQDAPEEEVEEAEEEPAEAPEEAPVEDSEEEDKPKE